MALESKLTELANKKKTSIVDMPDIDVEGELVPQAPTVNKQVDPQTVDDIKTAYKPQPPQQDITVSEQTYKPTYDIVDPVKVREQAQKMNPGVSNTDLLLGLIPLATSFLSGNGAGEGVDVSGKYYLDLAKEDKKRTQTLEDKLMEINKARAIASAKSKGGSDKLPTASNLVEVVGDDGVTRYQWVADAAGGKVDPNKSSDGKDERFNKAQKQAKELADRRMILQTRDKLISDPAFKTARTRYQATNDAINVLNQKNPIGDAGVKILFAKGIFGEVGNLTAQEQANFIGSPELERKFQGLINKYKTGLLGEADRDDLLKLAKHMRERSKLDTRNVARAYTSGLQSLGLDPSTVINPLLESSDVSPQFAKTFPVTVRKKGLTAIVKNYEELDEAKKEGWE